METEFGKNLWIKAAIVSPEKIRYAFEAAFAIGIDTRRAKSFLFEASWRMGLIRVLRQIFAHNPAIMYDVFADSYEPRDWWGSWEAWESAQNIFQIYTFSPRRKLVLGLAKLCFAYVELKCACHDCPATNPHMSPEAKKDMLQYFGGDRIIAQANGEDYRGLDHMRQCMESVFAQWHQRKLQAVEYETARDWKVIAGDWAGNPMKNPAMGWAKFVMGDCVPES